ncbi:MAG: MerR family transcriptional regulator [Deltaproteobacteria bacterium]|nr:MerR family transcriptional regulator [Deltaproteobacteria bacterium]
MSDSWTLAELVAEAASWIATLPPPKNGQVRAVPDERTVRYYAALGLLDRPAAMRGRTAIYGKRHLAQVIAIKRLQSAGHSLADIQAMWPTLDDLTLGRLTGVTLPARARAPRQEFWKKAPASSVEATRAQVIDAPKAGTGSRVQAHTPTAPVEVRIELAPGAVVTIALPEGASLTSADVHALRVAAAPFVAELAKRGLTAPDRGTLEEL